MTTDREFSALDVDTKSSCFPGKLNSRALLLTVGFPPPLSSFFGMKKPTSHDEIPVVCVFVQVLYASDVGKRFFVLWRHHCTVTCNLEKLHHVLTDVEHYAISGPKGLIVGPIFLLTQAGTNPDSLKNTQTHQSREKKKCHPAKARKWK